MIYAELSDALAVERLDVALSEATHPKWYRRLLIIKLSGVERMPVSKLAAGYVAICEWRINPKRITTEFISQLVACTNS